MPTEPAGLHGEAVPHEAVRDQLDCAVGIVHYDSWDELAACLKSLSQQRRRAVRVRVYDIDVGPAARSTGTADQCRRSLQASFPDVLWIGGPNVGFAAASNRLLSAETNEASPAGVQLILNADIELDVDHIEVLCRVFEAAEAVAVAGGKLLRPGRELVDSAGIRLPAHARPRDRGSETPDDARFDLAEDVFGVSGAAMALRTSALEGLALEGEVFDEDFFMYHEDTDLCWRAQRLGWRVRYEPAAVAVHRRGWRRDERFDTPAWIRRHSFKNHYLQLVKNETALGLVRRTPALLVWEVLRFGFVLLRDRAMWPAYADAWRAWPRATEKRRLLNARARRARTR